MWISNRTLLAATLLLLAGTAAGSSQSASISPQPAGGISAPLMAASAPANTGKILLVDGTSHMLQNDGTSKICLAGGC